jgi:hypothetical protein
MPAGAPEQLDLHVIIELANENLSDWLMISCYQLAYMLNGLGPVNTETQGQLVAKAVTS